MARKNKQVDDMPVIHERLVMLEHEGYTVDILPVLDIRDERILAGNGEISVPIKDTKQYISPEGRVYVTNVPDWYINETKHLAEVEMSTVISQAVAYQRPGSASSGTPPFLKILPWILVGLALLLYFFKK